MALKIISIGILVLLYLMPNFVVAQNPEQDPETKIGISIYDLISKKKKKGLEKSYTNKSSRLSKHYIEMVIQTLQSNESKIAGCLPAGNDSKTLAVHFKIAKNGKAFIDFPNSSEPVASDLHSCEANILENLQFPVHNFSFVPEISTELVIEHRIL